MDRSLLAARIYAAAHLTGTFTLRSGVVSHEYFDKYRFESDPGLLLKIAEGPEFDGRPLLIVEDVITSAGAVLDAARELRARGAVLDRVVCVIDRESGGRENLAAEGLTLDALFTMTELTAAAG